MKVVSVLGGLGSQMFKYAFYLSLKDSSKKEDVMIDTSFFMARNCLEMYELKSVFGIDDNDFLNKYSQDDLKLLVNNNEAYPSMSIRIMLSSYGDLDYYFMGKRYSLKAKRKALPISFRLRKALYLLRRIGISYSYDLNRFTDEKNYYFDEYPHNSDVHFPKSKELLKKVFTFPKFDDELNLNTKKDMEASESVAIHVRRADHLGDNKVLYKKGFYKKSVSYIKEKALKKPIFYIFSDDLDWCKENKQILGLTDDDSIIFVDWNRGSNGYKDMQLMTYCQHNIVPISSFSWWGYYLSDRKDKIVIAPKNVWDDIKLHF